MNSTYTVHSQLALQSHNNYYIAHSTQMYKINYKYLHSYTYFCNIIATCNNILYLATNAKMCIYTCHDFFKRT